MFVTTMIPKAIRVIVLAAAAQMVAEEKNKDDISDQQKFLLFVELFLSYVINTLVFKFTFYKQMSAQWKYTVF